MTTHPLVTKLAERAPDIAALAVAALLAGKLALVLWQVLPGSHRRPPGTPPGAVLTQGPALDVPALLGAHLFGAPPAGSGPIQATSAPLVLTGTLAGPDPNRGWAIIGETAQAARLYSAGATMPSGVRLAEVYTDHVLIDRNGARELLALPRKMGPGTGLMPVPPAEAPIAENVQKLIAQEPGLVGQVLRPQPVFANNQLRGFRLYPGTDRNKFTRLGLQPGDLVTQVNNVPIADPQHGMDILRTLGSATQATVTIERNGATQQIVIDSAKLSAVGGDAPSTGTPATATGTATAPPGTPPPAPDTE